MKKVVITFHYCYKKFWHLFLRFKEKMWYNNTNFQLFLKTKNTSQPVTQQLNQVDE